MRNQRRTKAPYTVDSIERALTHHEQRGSVDGWMHFTVPSSRWIVALADFDEIEFTDREAWALCCGLSAADRAAQPRVLREIGRNIGPYLLRCSRRAGEVLTIAAGGGPRNSWEELAVYCPLCNCNKSDERIEPNPVTEACRDARCLCHDEDWPTR